MKKLVSIVSILCLSLFAVASHAGDAEAGKAKSVTCAACHGGEGISPTGTWPNLAGQKEQYLLAQLKAFKDGTRVNAQMAPMVAGLSDDDMANLAAYYASLGCKE
jgi:cytochrome c553